jgi:hypothetical protein
VFSRSSERRKGLDSCFHKNDRLLFDPFIKISKILTDEPLAVNLFILDKKTVGRRKDGFGRPRRPP